MSPIFLPVIMNKFFYILLITSFLLSCTKESNFKKIIGSTMGTTYGVILEIKEQDINLIHQAIEKELLDINQLMSTYIPNSEINRFNKLNDDSCFKFSDKTWHVLLASREIYEQTNGAFEITLGPLISRWGFNVEEFVQKVPSQAEIDKLLTQVGTDKLIFDITNQCISKATPDLTINLSAIAKGYAVDQLAIILSNFNVTNFLVEIGGEVKASGLKSFNQHWTTAVVNPSGVLAGQQAVAINLFNSSIATSGDYLNYFEHDGQRFSHTINPINGYPIKHQLTSISVIHSSNMYADAYATALNVLGSDEAYSFANKHKLPIYTISKTKNGFENSSNKTFQAYIRR